MITLRIRSELDYKIQILIFVIVIVGLELHTIIKQILMHFLIKCIIS